MMEAASSSESSVNLYHITQRNNPEDGHFHTRRNEKIISHHIIGNSGPINASEFPKYLNNYQLFNRNCIIKLVNKITMTVSSVSPRLGVYYLSLLTLSLVHFSLYETPVYVVTTRIWLIHWTLIGNRKGGVVEASQSNSWDPNLTLFFVRHLMRFE
jgi:hypothetical protein